VFLPLPGMLSVCCVSKGLFIGLGLPASSRETLAGLDTALNPDFSPIDPAILESPYGFWPVGP